MLLNSFETNTGNDTHKEAKQMIILI